MPLFEGTIVRTRGAQDVEHAPSQALRYNLAEVGARRAIALPAEFLRTVASRF
jgi:hypothetical protein